MIHRVHLHAWECMHGGTCEYKVGIIAKGHFVQPEWVQVKVFNCCNESISLYGWNALPFVYQMHWSLGYPAHSLTGQMHWSLGYPGCPSGDITYSAFPRSGVGAPVVGEVDGEYNYDAKKHLLNWRLAVIDSSTNHGSMEFSITAVPSNFFPVTLTFASSKSYCHIEVRGASILRDYRLGRGVVLQKCLVISLVWCCGWKWKAVVLF